MSSAAILIAEANSGTVGKGDFLAIRIDGVDQAALDQAVPVWIAGLFGSNDQDPVSADVGGKAAIRVELGSGDPIHVYTSDDTVYVIKIDEEYKVPVLEALP